MDFQELDYKRLNILEEWFKDSEVLNRLSGTLPLERWFQFVQQSPNYFAWMVYDKDVAGAVGQIEIEIYPDRTAAIIPTYLKYLTERRECNVFFINSCSSIN